MVQDCSLLWWYLCPNLCNSTALFFAIQLWGLDHNIQIPLISRCWTYLQPYFRQSCLLCSLSLQESQGKVTGACVLVAVTWPVVRLIMKSSESRWKWENTISLNSQLSGLIGILLDDSAGISELLQAHKHFHSVVTQSESGHLTQAVIKPEVLIKLLIEPCSRHQSPPIKCCLLYVFVCSDALKKLDHWLYRKAYVYHSDMSKK